MLMANGQTMSEEQRSLAGRPSPYGAAAGALGVCLFLAGGLISGDPPSFKASGSELASYYEENRTVIQINCALAALATPLLLWFFSTVSSLARENGVRSGRTASLAYGCIVAWAAVFFVDLSCLAVAALRPENLAAAPELATALHDLEWLTMGAAAPLIVTALLCAAALSLRDGAIWPRNLGWLAVGAAAAYALRVGVLFTTEGPFAADALLGLYVPVGGLVSWILFASVALALRLRRPKFGTKFAQG